MGRLYEADRFIPLHQHNEVSPAEAFDMHLFRSVKGPRKNGLEGILKTELFGRRGASIGNMPEKEWDPTPLIGRRNMFTYQENAPEIKQTLTSDSLLQRALSIENDFRQETLDLMAIPRLPPRTIPKTPIRILDAPNIKDDFYLNLIDWSNKNILAVGLDHSVYVWNPANSTVNELCHLTNDAVASVAWNPDGSQLAVGTTEGRLRLYDATTFQRTHTFERHNGRVSTLAYSRDNTLSAAGRDCVIINYDARTHSSIQNYVGHRQEVCGLKWDIESQKLASGGNDNYAFVFDRRTGSSIYCTSEHTAAIKALAWSHHDRNLLATGGGTSDKRVRFHNIATGNCVHVLETGAQVCNIAWSPFADEFVTSHGYSTNQVVVWTYPKFDRLAVLSGHNARVLYMAMAPDGEHVMTGATDERLMLWKVFEKPYFKPWIQPGDRMRQNSSSLPLTIDNDAKLSPHSPELRMLR